MKIYIIHEEFTMPTRLEQKAYLATKFTLKKAQDSIRHRVGLLATRAACITSVKTLEPFRTQVLDYNPQTLELRKKWEFVITEVEI